MPAVTILLYVYERILLLNNRMYFFGFFLSRIGVSPPGREGRFSYRKLPGKAQASNCGILWNLQIFTSFVPCLFI